MKRILLIFFIASLVVVGGCNSNSEDQASIFRKCTVLGNESIRYARANYVKLFYYFNPEKFAEPYQQVKSFEYAVHRNVINTYDSAVRKIKTRDPETQALIAACLEIAKFSTTLVDQSYPRAISHQSDYEKLSDNFFIEINQIVKFDHNIGEFDKTKTSFKIQVDNYQKAVKAYLEKYKDELPEEVVSML